MSEQYRKINHLLMCIERRRKQIGENAMGALEILPSQHFALVWLKQMGRAASQIQLAEMMQVSPASVARTLKSLDRNGYIARNGGMDSRCNETAITRKGEQVLSQSLELFKNLDARQFQGFDAAEIEQLYALLNRLLNNLNQVKTEMELEK